MTYSTVTSAEPPPHIERVRHVLTRRKLTVSAIEYVTPAMLRITLGGEDLAGFTSLSPDDHVKILLPSTAGEEERRDYTPRHYDAETGSLVIDFAVHDAGPATQWAVNAKIGDELQIGGPRGSAVVSPEVKRWLLIGDETALPAIGRRIEEAGSEHVMTSLVAVAGPEERQLFETKASLNALWAYRSLASANDATPLLDLLKTVTIEPGTFVWIAAEASVTRALRAEVERRGLPQGWLKAAGYWVMGKADAHEKFE
ncbi:siderophore-interacting protein [Rhizobiaceae bacterium CRRU44]|uniref:Siderophore-interacting protein n=1 Tax=Ferranicluibacter rubi TaxID=2715133 RepID=A0AA43ZEE9_9HYPH|nr:siderophore-interacting protein [Ferranicluibacter rubi]NHT75510.1 siderophore-interacting protein [Ferranicluibacter rubi]PYE33942.1 NADPH-dependent ferric siderophore reductase [Rhizobium sp. PP-WC-1G-195]TCP80372.1 NADPH-dependent ferric siderophore reductase [Rhizobium sp. PP-CC-2G-626]